MNEYSWQLFLSNSCFMNFSFLKPNKFQKLILIILLLFSSTFNYGDITQPTITCSKLTIKTLEQSVKYVQS